MGWDSTDLLGQRPKKNIKYSPRPVKIAPLQYFGSNNKNCVTILTNHKK